MTTKVEKSIVVNAPVSTVYNQWTQFEDFPQFMGGVQQVTQLDDRRLHWIAEIAGVRREWDAEILEQVPDEKIAWAATEGATNAGAVFFSQVTAAETMVRLSLEYEPEGIVEAVGDKLNIIEKRAEADLAKFKSFIESNDYATGAWRGSVDAGMGVGTPGVEAAASSEGDSGKAGISPKTVVAGAAAAAAGIAAAGALKAKSGSSGSTETSATSATETTYATDTPVVTDTPIYTDTVVVSDVADTEAPIAPTGAETPIDLDTSVESSYSTDRPERGTV